MKHAKNFDGEFLDRQEQDAIIANSETKLLAGRLKLLNIAGADAEIVVDSVQNTEGDFAIDGPKVGTSLW